MASRTGQGIFRYKNGDQYSGHFLKGQKSGYGTMSWRNGDIYTGYWERDMQNGQGKLTKKNKDVYEGQFRNGLLEGLIIIHYTDGSKFRGSYHNGKRNAQRLRSLPQACALKVTIEMTVVMESSLNVIKRECYSKRLLREWKAIY